MNLIKNAFVLCFQKDCGKFVLSFSTMKVVRATLCWGLEVEKAMTFKKGNLFVNNIRNK